MGSQHNLYLFNNADNTVKPIEELINAKEIMLGERFDIKGYLRISIPPNFEPWYYLLHDFQKCYPGIRVFVYTTERKVDLISDGIDIALRIGAVEHESMVAKKVLSYKHIIVASKKTLDIHGIPTSPSELKRYPCGAWGISSYYKPSWVFDDYIFYPTPTLLTNDYNQLKKRALMGDIIAEIPPFMISEEIENEELVPLLLDYPLPNIDVNFVYPLHKNTSSLLKVYLEFCKNYLGSNSRKLKNTHL